MDNNEKQKLAEKVARWKEDPIYFINTAMGATPTEIQEELINSLMINRQVAVKSGRTVGKTCTAAWIINWFIRIHKECKIFCTSPNAKQLNGALWPEIEKWHKIIPPSLRGNFEFTSESFYHRTNRFNRKCWKATAKKEDKESFQGLYSQNLLVIIDEASGMPIELINSLLPAMSSPNAYLLVMGNPLHCHSFFFDVWAKKLAIIKDRLTFSSEHPASRADKDVLKSFEQDFGRDSQFYMSNVLGEFPTTGTDTIIPIHLLYEAKDRTRDSYSDIEWEENKDQPVIWGLDVGEDVDRDDTILAKRKGFIMKPLQKIKGDFLQIANTLLSEYRKTPEEEKPNTINVDTIGVGSNLDVILKKLKGLPARKAKSSYKPYDKHNYLNARAEMWFSFRNWLKDDNPIIPDDEKLIGASSLMKYEVDEMTGKLKIEKKKDFKQRTKLGLDRSDAACLTFFKNKQIKPSIYKL